MARLQITFVRCHNCASPGLRGPLCGACEHKAQKAADILAKGMGHTAGHFARKNDRWELRVGGSAPWTSDHPFACTLVAIRQFESAAQCYANQVQASAKHLRSNSTAQKEYDRLQDIVSRAIEALGVELKYA